MSALVICAAAPLANARSAVSANAAATALNSATSHRLRPRSPDVARLRAQALDLQVEDAGGVEAEDVALGLVGQERDGGDRAGRVEVPVRPVGREQQLRV